MAKKPQPAVKGGTMDIMNMTLHQLIQTIEHHPLRDIEGLIAFDNILVTACAAAGWTKAETFLSQLSKFIYALIANLKKPTITVSSTTEGL